MSRVPHNGSLAAEMLGGYAAPHDAAPAPLPLEPLDGRGASDFLHIESIVLNLDAALRVQARAHFQSWTQGLLQSLIRHEFLVCLLCGGEPAGFRGDAFSTATSDAAVLTGLLREDGVCAALRTAWEERECQPFSVDLGPGQGIAGAFTRELERLGATQLLVHGMHDAAGRALSLFAFACRPRSVGSREAYLAQLLAPSLHAAWARTQLQRRAEQAGEQQPGRGVLTAREQVILQWISRGKSNFEIGAILDISPLTVKNHVQKILRKLDAVNRTQAVSKALELRILNP